MTRKALSHDDIHQFQDYLTPHQIKRLERQNKKLEKQEQTTGNKTEKHHNERVQNIKAIVPLNDKQARYLQCLQNCNQIFSYGSAGSGKTFIAVSYSAQEFLKKNITKIILTRPNIAIGGKTPAALPGGVYEKMEATLAEPIQILKKILSPDGFEIAVRHSEIEIVPFEYIRGRSFNNAIIIVNEAQNTTVDEMVSFVTRVGENSKVILDGDLFQTDIKGLNGLQWAIDTVKANPKLQEYTGIVEFTSEDIVRSGLCKEWVVAIEKFYKKNNAPTYETVARK